VIVVLVLLLHRLPVWLLLRPVTCSLRSNRDAIFNGWFGPIGVGAIYYATEVHEALTNELWVVASLVVFGSIVLHGITATPLIRIYARRAERSSGRRKAAHGHGGTRRGRRGERSPPQAVRRRRRDEV
jgi:NhaP-type Na+/H+ or K+/H+ antiporter